MAYVNMTLDGQTKRTDSIKLVGADGVSKNAILSAVLEASDVGSSGGVASGTFVGDGTSSISVKADSSNLIVRVKGEFPSVLVAGKRTIALFIIDKDNSITTAIGSNGNGTAASAVSSTVINSQASPIKIAEDGSLTIDSASNGCGVFTNGITYEWIKW